ncbi:hypothetical protein D3C84_537030 [compost metagenome]
MQFIDLATLLAADVDVARIPVAPVAGFHAAGPAPALLVRPFVRQTQSVVFAIDIQHLEDGVEQRLGAVEAGQFQAVAAVQLQDAEVAQAVEVEVALLVAGDIARRRLLGVLAHLRLGQVAGQVGVGFHMGEVEARGDPLVDAPAEVGEVALVVLPRVVAVAVLGVVVEADESIPVAEVLGEGAVQALVVEAAGFGAQGGRWRGLPAGGDEVDGTAQVGRAIAPGVGAAQDFDVVGGQGLDGLEVEAAVGQVDRCAVLHQQQATTVEGALQAGAADRQTRLLGAEARLDEDAGGQPEGILQGAAAATLVGFGIHHPGTAGDMGEVGLLLGQGRGGGVLAVLPFHQGPVQFHMLGMGKVGEAHGQGEQAQHGDVVHGALPKISIRHCSSGGPGGRPGTSRRRTIGRGVREQRS